ncbi:hypothetical protein [Schaalia sp. ZJ1691]|uniref:hypothetical protein n=1 Tax=Schaalia sp. ZJ1691 TaxID=2709404 RepID=UPI0013ED223E|nr:hypothetical protein [Schaalia sp. ZJ1691]
MSDVENYQEFIDLITMMGVLGGMRFRLKDGIAIQPTDIRLAHLVADDARMDRELFTAGNVDRAKNTLSRHANIKEAMRFYEEFRWFLFNTGVSVVQLYSAKWVLPVAWEELQRTVALMFAPKRVTTSAGKEQA